MYTKYERIHKHFLDYQDQFYLILHILQTSHIHKGPLTAWNFWWQNFNLVLVSIDAADAQVLMQQTISIHNTNLLASAQELKTSFVTRNSKNGYMATQLVIAFA